MLENAVILMGGRGTRLENITDIIPKALIDVRGRALTEHVIDILRPSGIKTVYMSIGYLADKVIEHFGAEEQSMQRWGFQIKYLKEEQPLGTGGWMRDLRALRFIDNFIVVNGDNLFDINFNEMCESHRRNNAIVTIALKPVEDVESRGVVKMAGEKIVKFVEKPKKENAPFNLISSGYYIFSNQVFDYVPLKTRIMLETDLFPMLAEMGGLFGWISDKQWFDTGTLERWKEVNEKWRV